VPVFDCIGLEHCKSSVGSHVFSLIWVQRYHFFKNGEASL